MTDTTFSNRSNAARAARKELGGEYAVANVDYHIVAVGKRFAWRPGKAPKTSGPAPAKPAGGNLAAVAMATKKPGRKPRAKAPKPASDPRATKADAAIARMRSARGVTGAELSADLGWAPHTVRGFISGHVRKKLGLEVTAERDGATTRYRIA